MEAVVKELQHDAQLGVFFAPDCNVSAIASEVVARDAAAASSTSGGGGASHSERFVLRVDDAVRRIDRVITEHIGANHSALLRHAGSADELQRRVTDVQASVRSLQLAAGDLESVVAAQHRRLRAGLRKQQNVDKCADILRRLLRFHQLSERVLGSPLSVATGSSAVRGRAASSEHALLAAAASSSSSSSSSEVAGELAALALAIREIEALVADPQFEDLSVVRQSLPSVRRVGAAIRRDARASLRAGMQRLSQADVGDALQILFFLGNLSESVQTSVNDVIQAVERKCGAAIAEEKLGGGGGSAAQPTGAHEAAAQKADVWKAVQEVFEVLRVHALQVWNLQRVLVKMPDAGSGRSYLELVVEEDEPTLFATFWEVSCAIVRELFTATLGYRAAVKLALVSSYPRMREEANRVLHELCAATHHPKTDAERLSDALAAAAATATPGRGRSDALEAIASSAAERNQLLEAMAPLFDAFTDCTYRRLANPIKLMFPQSANFHTSPPGRSDMQTLARTIFSEVDQAGQDPVLLDGALQQTRKAVTLFCANVKRITNSGKAATATTPAFGRTPAQAHNVSLLNVLHQLDEALSEVATRVTTAAASSSRLPVSTATERDVTTPQALQALCAKELQPCRELIQSLEYAILGTYLQSLCAILEGIFAKMHDESFADRRPASAPASAAANAQSSGSRYMAEFGGAFHVVLEEHIRRLPNALFAGVCVSDFVARLISVFVRHVALLRPLEENGKLRLANDMAQLELRLEHLLPLKTLGAPYEELRAFRHMMFLESSSVLRDATVDKIRPTNVWHHLITRAPVELQLPHQLKRWSAAKYVDWLDRSAGFEGRTSPSAKSAEALSATQLPLGYPCLKDRRTALHAEKEAWKEVGKCLDAYAQRVSVSTAAPSAAMSPIYDLLLESGGILLAGYEVVLSR